MGQVAMHHGHYTGCNFVFVLSGDSDGGGTHFMGGDFSGAVHRGDARVAGAPRHVLIGGIVRLHRGGERAGATLN